MATGDPREDIVYCVRCGAASHIGAQFCEQCGARLTYYQAADRPGCVTAYVIINFILLAVVLCGLAALGDRYEFASGDLLFVFVVTGFQVVGLVGVWQMKNWGRFIILIFGVIGVLGSLARITGDMTGGQACGALIGIGINVYVLYWFWSHGELFE